MPRCIVLIRSHELLQEGWRKRSFGPAGPLLDDRVKVAGVRFDEAYHPVEVWRRIGGGDDPPSASGFNYAAVGPAVTYAVRADADDADAIERLRRDRRSEVVGVFADPVVSPFPSAYCGEAAVGATDDVARALGVPALSRAGLTGEGVHVAVVDTGIDGSRIPVTGGWAPTLGYVPGSTAPTHGTMVAYDVRIAAPDAQILDYALLRSRAGTWAAFLSDAIAAFADLVERVNGSPGRWVVTTAGGCSTARAMPQSARRRTTPPIPTIRSIRSLPLSSRPARMCSSRRGTAAPTAPMGGAAPATRAREPRSTARIPIPTS